MDPIFVQVHYLRNPLIEQERKVKELEEIEERLSDLERKKGIA